MTWLEAQLPNLLYLLASALFFVGGLINIWRTS